MEGLPEAHVEAQLHPRLLSMECVRQGDENSPLLRRFGLAVVPAQEERKVIALFGLAGSQGNHRPLRGREGGERSRRSGPHFPEGASSRRIGARTPWVEVCSQATA